MPELASGIHDLNDRAFVTRKVVDARAFRAGMTSKQPRGDPYAACAPPASVFSQAAPQALANSRTRRM